MQAVPRRRTTSTSAARTACTTRDRRHRRRQDGRLRRQAESAGATRAAARPADSRLRSDRPRTDVMGYHDARESRTTGPTRSNFVLQDHMFEPNASWSLPAHLFMVSDWSADVHAKRDDPMTLRANALEPGRPGRRPSSDTASDAQPDYAWTDLTYLLHKHHVSWGYYVVRRHRARLRERRTMTCDAGQAERADARASGTRCPYFDTVTQDDQLGNIQTARELLRRGQGRHPARGLLGRPDRTRSASTRRRRSARARPTSPSSINAVMPSPDWNSHRDLPRLGRLGRLLRPRRAAERRRERLRPARARARDQPVRRSGLHRPPDAELRRLR